MANPRKYGSPPFTVAVIHGGPGAAGQMRPVAQELSQVYGSLEPLQTSTSLEGQMNELRILIMNLVGTSPQVSLRFASHRLLLGKSFCLPLV